jgi:hypothetical protein
MPFDIAGNFTRSYNFQQDRDNGIKILAARVDGEFDNFATGMNLVFFRDGRVPMQADLRMNINRITGLADGVAAAPALKFNTDANTGPYLDGISRYAIAVNSVQRMVATTTGVDVTGNLSASGNATVSGTAAVTGNITMGGNLVATQSYVAGAYAPLASPTFTGTPAAPTPATADSTTKIATTAYVQANLVGLLTTAAAAATYAPLASPGLTGTPTAPTPATADNTTKIATTAYVQAQGYQTAVVANATYAPIASPTFTGTPAAPTAAAGTNTTQVATTAFVDRLRSFSNASGGGKTLDLTDRGEMYKATGAVTVPSAVFSTGDVVVVYNDSAAGIALTQGAGLTLRWSGTATTGSRTILQRGFATIVFVGASEAVVSGDLS